jgi:crotonobetainyl-CoA:carnitine CoA-transferase CaiB-like acyl-CoA transferase
MADEALASNPRFESNDARTRHRDELETAIQAIFSSLTYAQAADLLTESQTAFGAINSVNDLISHPQLRTRPMLVRGRQVEVPAAPYATEWDDESFPPVPGIGEHQPLP